MQMTDYHAAYYAHLLTHRPARDTASRFLPTLMGAAIDVHPHQIDAAIFALRSPFGNGVLLADEEGLGKTIEACLALSQCYAEGNENLLVCVPERLLAHWRAHLEERFGLPVISLNEHHSEPGVVLTSHRQAIQQSSRVAAVSWDLCVIDEAHRVVGTDVAANENQSAAVLRDALAGKRKLLLTATPMQKSLLDLYHLMRFADDTSLGSDAAAFRRQYMEQKSLRQELAERAQMICYRTLRKNALTMRQPRRVAWTISYEPYGSEIELGKRLSLYLHREDLRAFPKIQSHYIRLTLYKLLSSSTFALCDTLEKVHARIEPMPDIEDECRDLTEVIAAAKAIECFKKPEVLSSALKAAFAQLRKSGAPRKAVIFTEYQRTQKFLYELLTAQGYCVSVYGASGAEEEFRARGDILLAGDKASEILYAQYCACVINYDLPWNAQKLEQRISRCHRYGQKHDVLVINLVDPTNRSDRRVFTLLNKKLKLFDDTFGASETLLGAVHALDELPKDAELRTRSRIIEDDKEMDKELSGEIERRTVKAEAELLSRFDEEVARRFTLHAQVIQKQLPQMSDWLWAVTKHRLHRDATFMDEKRAFILTKSPCRDVRLSGIHFTMDASAPRSQRYRLDHPLARRILDEYVMNPLLSGSLELEQGEEFASGERGVLGLWRLSARSAHTYQSVPILCGLRENGTALSQEQCENLMRLPVVSCQYGARYVDEDTGAVRVMELVSESEKVSLQTVCDVSIKERKDEMLCAMDAELTQELSRIHRLYEDEALSLKIEEVESARRVREMKAQISDGDSFAERFAQKRIIAEAEQRRKNAEAKRFMMASRMEFEKQERVEKAREQS